MKIELPPPELLRKILRYEPETGKLFWLERPVEMFSCSRMANAWNSRCAGKQAFTCSDGAGYACGTLLGKLRRAHRVAWAVYYGAWPASDIDHKNGVRNDNRIKNLTDAGPSLNAINKKMNTQNTSGFNGVFWNNGKKKWTARIKRNGVTKHIGHFNCIFLAIKARQAENENMGFSKRHGRK